MTDAKLLTDAILGSLAAILFAHVGRLNGRRRVEQGGAQRALRQFSAWWLGLAVFTLVGALRSLLGAFGHLEIGAHVALEAISYVPLLVALWGLLSYLLYIYAGTHRWQPLLKGYHAALCVGLWLLLTWTRPVSVTTGWRTDLVYTRPVEGLPLALLVFAILGPVLAAAVGYAGLYRRTSDPAARRRVLLVSVALVLWFGLSALARGTAVALPWWPLAARGLALLATLLLVIAFRGEHPARAVPA